MLVSNKIDEMDKKMSAGIKQKCFVALHVIAAVIALFYLLLIAGFAHAAPPTLEIMSGSGTNSTGPSITSQSNIYQFNTDNPNGNTASDTYFPKTSVNYRFENQVFGTSSSNSGLVFGGSDDIFIPLADQGSPVDSDFASSRLNTNNPQGINTNNNYGTRILLKTGQLGTSYSRVTTNVNGGLGHYIGDIVVEWNKPVFNPVMNVSGLGGAVGTAASIGISAQFELVNPPTGTTISRLAGRSLTVSGSTIRNNESDLGATTGSGGASGSIQVLNSNPITSLRFKVYVRSDATTNTRNNWGSSTAGDAFLFSAASVDSTVGDLFVSKTNNVNSLISGGTTTYTVRATNGGPSTILTPVLKDISGTGLTAVSVICSAASGNKCTTAPTLASLSSGITISSLATGEFYEVLVTSNVTATSGNVTNTATIELPTFASATGVSCVTSGGITRSFNSSTGSCTSTDTDTIIAGADLAINKIGSSSVTQDDTASYTIKVWNKGLGTVNSSTMTDTVPTNLTNVTWSCTASGSASCGTTTNGSGNNISVTTGSLPVNTSTTAPTSGSYLTFTVTGKASTVGTITNTASIAAPSGTTDPDTTNNNSSANTSINTPAAITPDTPQKEARFEIVPDIPTIYRGTGGTQLITITNKGPDAATNTVATVTPATQTGVSVTGVSVVGGSACTQAAGQWSCSYGSVANNANFQLSVSYNTAAGSSLGTAQQVSVKVGSSEFNPGSGVGETLYNVWGSINPNGSTQFNEIRPNGAFAVAYGTVNANENVAFSTAWPTTQANPTGAYLTQAVLGANNSVFGPVGTYGPMISRIITNLNSDTLTKTQTLLALDSATQSGDNRRAWQLTTGIYVPAGSTASLCVGNAGGQLDDSAYIMLNGTKIGADGNYNAGSTYIQNSVTLTTGYNRITYRIANRNTPGSNEDYAQGLYGEIGLSLNGAACTAANLDATASLQIPASINIIDPAKVKIAKISNGGVGQFNYTGMTNLMNSSNTAVTTDSVTTTTAGTVATSTQQNYATTLNSAVSITESAVANYNLATASCTDANSGATGNTGTFGSLAGNVLTIPAANVKAAADITCTFTNNKQRNITLTKSLSPTTDGGKFNLVVNSTTVATDIGNGGTGTLAVTVGSTVNFSETAGTGTTLGNYVTGYSCNTTPATTGNTTSGSFTVPDADVSCTFTNTKRPTLQLAKAWGANSSSSDSASIGATTGGANNTTAFTTAGGTAANSGTAVNIAVGNTITFPAETGTNIANYNTVLSCLAGGGATANSLSGTNGQVSNTLLIGAGDAGKAIVCTYTNTRKSTTFRLAKIWGANSTAGNVANIGATTGLINNTSAFTSTASTSTNGTAVTVYAGETATLPQETMSTGTLANYNTTLSCDAGTLSGTNGQNTGNTLTIPAAATSTNPITCTYTNTPKTATLQLSKTWGANSLATDSATIGATTGGSANTAAFTTAGGTNANSGVVTVTVGNTITFPAETGTNIANYNSGFSCLAGGSTTANSVSGSNGQASNTLVIGAGDAGKAIVCTYNNTRKTANITLRKAWSGAASNDSATVNLKRGATTVDSLSSTSTGNNTDIDSTPFAAFVGETLNLSEVLGGSNTGQYTANLACDNGVTVAGNGDFTVPATATNCTVTNTRKTRTITLTKALSPTTDAGKFNLLVNGTAVATNIGHGGTGNVVVPVGSSVSISETAGTVTTLSNYSTTYSCNTSPATTGSNTSGSFTQPDADVACTFTNTRKSATLTIVKQWQNGKSGDAISIPATTGLSNNTAVLTSTATVAGNYATNGTSVIAYAGETATLGTETFTTGSAANYNTTLSCSGAADTNLTDGLTISAADTAITCTYTNSRIAQQLNVTKQWQNAVNGHTATVATTGGTNNATFNSTSTGNNSTSGTAVTVYAGDVVTLPAETFGGGASAAQYNSALACSGGTTLANGAVNRSITISNSTTATTCTYSNTRKSATLTLSKTWAANSVKGDTVTVTSSGFGNNATSGTSTATAAGNTTTGTSVTVYAGETGSITEAFGTGSASNYNATLACSGNSNALSGNNLTVNAADTAINCTYTNTVKQADLVIDKVAPATVTQGSSLSYTIKVWNKGPSAVSNSTVTDTVPASLTGVTWTCAASGSASCGAATNGSGNNISVTTGSLPVNSSNTAPTSGSYLTFTITATASSVGSVTNTATVGNPVGAVESNNANNSSSATTNVIASTIVISGRVFEDNSGTTNVAANAYNGTQQAGEIGLGKVSVRLTNCASTTLATTQTDANGDYSFSIGAGSLPTPNFCIVETNLADYTSVSGSSTYNRTTDTITVSNTAATSYSNNNFGDAKLALVLSEQGQQTVIAGGVVDYPHRIVSSSVLDLTALNKTASQQPANANDQAWESLLYRDTNCNGKVDAGEALLANSLPLTILPLSTQQVCVVQRVRAPVNASSEAQYVSQLQASYKATLADSSVISRTSNIVTDTTLTGSAGLDLQKRVRVVASCPSTAADTNPFVTSNQASNGNFLEYEIIYRNNSVKNLIDVSLKDSVPTGTVFQNVSCNVNPVSCTATHNSGALTWQMTGSLLPNKQGTVRFCVAAP